MNLKIYNIKCKNNDQSGAALVISIFAILLLTILCFAIISTGLTSQEIAQNSREQTEAFYISESGLTHATQILLQTDPSEFNAILQTGDGIAGTGDELSTRPSALTPIPLAGLTLGKGHYVVKISDDSADMDGNPNADSNGRIVITSIGYGQNGAMVTTEAIIGVSSTPAILVNGNLKINGNPSILGSGGSIHANGTIDLDGVPCAAQYFSSSGSIIDPTQSRSGVECKSAGVTRPNQPVIPVPTWNIRTSFYSRADFILGASGASAGKVYNAIGTELAMSGNDWIVDVSTGSKFSWDSGNKRWVHSGSVLPNGTYYSEGNLELSSNFGSVGVPAVVTFIAEGYIIVLGNPYMRPELDNYSLMAGTDLRISGNPGAGEINFQGIHYAGHQIGFFGYPSINGVVIAANQADTNSPGCGCNFIPLSSGYQEISGNPTITYHGGLFSGNANLISWREVRY